MPTCTSCHAYVNAAPRGTKCPRCDAVLPTVAEDAIETADAATSNAVLPTYSELLAALQRLMDAPKLGTAAGMRRARENAQQHLDRHARTMRDEFGPA